jgi:hypothetical protein
MLIERDWSPLFKEPCDTSKGVSVTELILNQHKTNYSKIIPDEVPENQI